MPRSTGVSLARPIARIKRLQDLLGDIHDCDVWIEQMSLAIVRQRARRRHPGTGAAGASISAVAPFRRLLVNREKRRARLYRQFVRVLGHTCPARVLGDPASAALTGQQTAFSSRRSLPAKEEREAFLRLAAVAPDHVAHSRTVTALALRLFDELAPLHGLSRRDRTLLSYAATVHDIGWIHGQAGHQKKSAGMILASPSLPVPVREQGIISLAAGLHGGKMQARPDGLFTLLVPADQKRVRTLAALLRVADGLDYLHAGKRKWAALHHPCDRSPLHAHRYRGHGDRESPGNPKERSFH